MISGITRGGRAEARHLTAADKMFMKVRVMHRRERQIIEEA